MKGILQLAVMVIVLLIVGGVNFSHYLYYDYGNKCYTKESAAWDACNSKYNGKCYFLGRNYNLCLDNHSESYAGIVEGFVRRFL